MSRPMLLAAAAGLALAVLLAINEGYGAVAEAFVRIGPLGALLIVLLRVVQIAGAGTAWWMLLSPTERGSPTTFIALRWVRESINTLLPVAQVGGDLAGARLLARRGLSGGLAGASVIVDLLAQTATQLVFSLAGLALLLSHGASPDLLVSVALGLSLMTLGVLAVLLARHWGGFRMIDTALSRLAESPSWRRLAGIATLNEHIARLHAARPRLALAFLIHLVMWLVGTLEIWIGLAALGHPCTLAEAIVIESLGHTVRAAAFVVPGALGIQEGGFIALGAVYGVPAPVALALSLVKRIPELVLGLPGLVLWHRLETRSVAPDPSRPPDAGAA